jgi:hypothetical protein
MVVVVVAVTASSRARRVDGAAADEHGAEVAGLRTGRDALPHRPRRVPGRVVEDRGPRALQRLPLHGTVQQQQRLPGIVGEEVPGRVPDR